MRVKRHMWICSEFWSFSDIQPDSFRISWQGEPSDVSYRVAVNASVGPPVVTTNTQLTLRGLIEGALHQVLVEYSDVNGLWKVLFQAVQMTGNTDNVFIAACLYFLFHQDIHVLQKHRRRRVPNYNDKKQVCKLLVNADVFYVLVPKYSRLLFSTRNYKLYDISAERKITADLSEVYF